MEEEDESYEHACMRAELLGKTPPTREEYEKEHPPKESNDDDNDITTEIENQDSVLNESHTKMDELNSILSSTQRKINNFKNSAYGSLSGMLFRRDSTNKDSVEQNKFSASFDGEQNSENSPSTSKADPLEPAAFNPSVKTNKSLDIDKKMTSHLDKLDSLINKAERAEISMSVQNKDMKKFLK